MNQPGPQWAADPFHRHELRFWNGESWTEQVLDTGRPAEDAPGWSASDGDLPPPGPPTARSRTWPTSTEYTVVVQDPASAFSDEGLRSADVAIDMLGMPQIASGQNAVVFRVERGDEAVAVRCFITAPFEGAARYDALFKHLLAHPCDRVAGARWIEQGVRVDDEWWPVVVMPWVAGLPMNLAVEDALDEPSSLLELAENWWRAVHQLQDADIAHGDLQHGNVLVDHNLAVRFVDLDGIWVPGVRTGAPNETGHPNYQHPQRSREHWGPDADLFSAVVIYMSLVALATDPNLFRFAGGENLILSRSDYEAPGASEAWQALRASREPIVVELADLIAGWCRETEPPTGRFAEAMLPFAARRPAVPLRSVQPSPPPRAPLGARVEGGVVLPPPPPDDDDGEETVKRVELVPTPPTTSPSIAPGRRRKWLPWVAAGIAAAAIGGGVLVLSGGGSEQTRDEVATTTVAPTAPTTAAVASTANSTSSTSTTSTTTTTSTTVGPTTTIPSPPSTEQLQLIETVYRAQKAAQRPATTTDLATCPLGDPSAAIADVFGAEPNVGSVSSLKDQSGNYALTCQYGVTPPGGQTIMLQHQLRDFTWNLGESALTAVPFKGHEIRLEELSWDDAEVRVVRGTKTKPADDAAPGEKIWMEWRLLSTSTLSYTLALDSTDPIPLEDDDLLRLMKIAAQEILHLSEAVESASSTSG